MPAADFQLLPVMLLTRRQRCRSSVSSRWVGDLGRG
jgi:hypothetical protein